jgi:hypothetical protein
MRKAMIVLGVVALVGGTSWAVMAATGSGRTPVNCMDTVWSTSPASTSSTQWAVVPGFQRAPFAALPVAINVSALVSGPPVEFRILSTNIGGQTLVSKPGPTRFVPGSVGANSFAYQWVDLGTAAPHALHLRLQWRSPSGNPVHMLRGDMSILYATDTGSCQG